MFYQILSNAYTYHKCNLIGDFVHTILSKPWNKYMYQRSKMKKIKNQKFRKVRTMSCFLMQSVKCHEQYVNVYDKQISEFLNFSFFFLNSNIICECQSMVLSVYGWLNIFFFLSLFISLSKNISFIPSS